MYCRDKKEHDGEITEAIEEERNRIKGIIQEMIRSTVPLSDGHKLTSRQSGYKAALEVVLKLIEVA